MVGPSATPGAALDPEVLARISQLTLRARLVVEGALAGLHRSRQHGSSIEFAEHKEYSPGDEIRHLDWKRYARTDRYTVKRFEEETSLRSVLLLDASGSMGYGEAGAGKWDYAVTLAAALAYLMLRQSDAVGLELLSGPERRFLPPRGERSHLKALLEALGRQRPAGRIELAGELDGLASRLRRRALLIVFSDCFSELSGLLPALVRLRRRRHEVALVQVLHRDELELPFEELTLFESLEDRRELLAEPRMVRAEYLRRLEQHNRELARGCRAHAIQFQRVVSDEPADRALVRFLAERG